jgi:hypothetical protein
LQSDRQKRQIFFEFSQPIASVRAAWSKQSGIGGACLTSRGILGSCQSFRTCYPFFKSPELVTKYPNLQAWDYWVLGNHDSCSYFTPDGRQAFGVCCVNVIETPQVVIEDSTSPPFTVASDEQKFELPNRQPALGIFSVWPPALPPLPTHPPNHAAPTHPPSHFILQNPIETTTRPSLTTTTTWGTRPPYQTKPTTTKRPFFVTTPPTISNDIFEDSSCGARNGNLVSFVWF